MRGVAAFPGVAAGRLGHREAGRYARTMAETPTGPGSGPASARHPRPSRLLTPSSTAPFAVRGGSERGLGQVANAIVDSRGLRSDQGPGRRHGEPPRRAHRCA